MVRGLEIEGSAKIIYLGGTRPRGALMRAVNDNVLIEEIKTVTLRKTLALSGVTIKIKVPVSEYYGVAVATEISEQGALTSRIMLLHPDEALCYEVYEEQGNTDVVAEWQNWGRKLRLPLFIKAGDGSLLPYGQQVDGVLLGSSNARRRMSAESNRRPRFSSRRKPGSSEG